MSVIVVTSFITQNLIFFPGHVLAGTSNLNKMSSVWLCFAIVFILAGGIMTENSLINMRAGIFRPIVACEKVGSAENGQINASTCT